MTEKFFYDTDGVRIWHEPKRGPIFALRSVGKTMEVQVDLILVDWRLTELGQRKVRLILQQGQPIDHAHLRHSFIHVGACTTSYRVPKDAAARLMQEVITVVCDTRYHCSQDEARADQRVTIKQKDLWGMQRNSPSNREYQCKGCKEWFNMNGLFRHIEIANIIGRCPTAAEMERCGMKRNAHDVWLQGQKIMDLDLEMNAEAVAFLEAEQTPTP